MNITELYPQDSLAMMPHDPFAIGPSSPNALATSAEAEGIYHSSSSSSSSSTVMTEEGFPFRYERKNKNDNTNPIPDNDSLQSLLKDNLGGRLPENTLKRLLEYTSPLPPVLIKEDPVPSSTSSSRSSLPHHSQQQRPMMDNCSDCVGPYSANNNNHHSSNSHNNNIYGVSTNLVVDNCCPPPTMTTSPISLGMEHMATPTPLDKVPFKRTSIDHTFDYQAEYLMSIPIQFDQQQTPQLPPPTASSCTGCSDPTCQPSPFPQQNNNTNNMDMNWTTSSSSNSNNPLPYSYGSIMKASKSKKKDQQEDYIDLSEYLNMPQSEAARRLNIPTSSLSKKWKEVSGDRKWPYRTVCKLDKEISSILDHITTRPLPPDIEQTLGYLLTKRNQELRPVAIRFRKKELLSAN